MTRGRPRRRESAYLVCHRTSRMLNCLLLILLLLAKTTDAWMTVAPSFSWPRRARSPSCQHGAADGAASVAAASSRTLLRAGVTPPSSQEEHSHHHSGATALDDVYYANQFATATPPLEATAAATPLETAANVPQQQPQQPESSSAAVPRITLTRFLDQAVEENPELRDLQSLLLGLQMACKTISHLVNRAGLVYTAGTSNSNSSFQQQQPHPLRMNDSLHPNENVIKSGNERSMTAASPRCRQKLYHFPNAILTGQCWQFRQAPGIHEAARPAQHARACKTRCFTPENAAT